MKSSLHSLIYFLSYLLYHLRLPSPELGQILDNNSLKRILLQPKALNFCQLTLPLELFAIYPWDGPHGVHCLLLSCIVLGMFTAPLPNNRQILLLSFAPAGMCLPSRCLAMGRYVRVLYQVMSLSAFSAYLVLLAKALCTLTGSPIIGHCSVTCIPMRNCL
jgi:hypothetical protein